MNEVNDTNDPPEESIADGLATAADDIDVGSADVMLTSVREVVKVRRRRRNTVLGVAAAGTLALSGVVVANVVGDDGSDDTIMSADETVPASTEAPAEVEDTTPSTVESVPDEVPEIVPGAAGEPVRVQASPSEPISTSDPDVAVAADFVDVPQLFAWKDGFLAVRREVEPQPLPAELPPEITEQFPPEVVDFFADGLPPTIDEAMAQLDEAGLLDEVTEIVTANPDVFEAIYAMPAEVNLSVRFSTDGVEWSDLDASFPEEMSYSYNASVAGDRFVIVSDDQEYDVDGSPEAEDREITVLSSTDLVDWTRQVIPVPAPPADTPDVIRVETYPENLIAGANRWVLPLSTYSDIDLLSLLDDDLRARVQNSSGGYGTSTDAEGAYFEIYDAVDEEAAPTEPQEPSEVISFTWAELGLDGPPENLHESASVVWTSNWVDAPVSSTTTENEMGWYRTVVVDNGFVAAGDDGVRLSSDGLTWTDVEVPVEGWVDGLMSLGDSVIVFVMGNDGTTSQHQLDLATTTWSTIDIDGLPDNVGVDRSARGAVTLYENEGYSTGSTTSVGTAEVDGYQIELRSAWSFNSGEFAYTVTDIATGEVVSTETTTDVTDGPAFEFAEESYEVRGEEGITFLDPATGELLVEVRFSQMEYVELDADGEPIPEPAFDSNPGIPARWLLATDGESWIVDQISEASSADTEEAYFEAEIGDVAVNNGIVLISKYDGTFIRYDIG